MVKLKTKEEIELMQEGGRRLKEVIRKLMQQIRAGITTSQIDKSAEILLRKMEGEPSFKRVKGYRWSTCLCINEQIVHTPPADRVLQEGDILTVDLGMYYKGFHTDFANTIEIGEVKQRNRAFLGKGKKTLELAIKKVKTGTRLGEVSKTIQEGIEKAGYSIVKELTGHGIGRDLHEDPNIPGFLEGPLESTLLVKPGLVVAIEVIYARGDGEMEYETKDGWSIRTSDRSLSACFEHTIAVTDGGSIILT